MGRLTDMRGGTPAYRVCKTAVNAMTRVLATELGAPGSSSTPSVPDGSEPTWAPPAARRSVEGGTDTTVWLATRPDNRPIGAVVRDRRPLPRQRDHHLM